MDTISPGIANISPTGTTTDRPTISATLTDGGSGIDPESMAFSIDGINDAGAASLSAGIISYLPAENLSPGSHIIQLSISDLAGNPQTTAWTFTVPQPAVAQAAPGSPVSRQLSFIEYWQDYGALPGLGAGGWIISGFQAFPNTYFLPWYDNTAGNRWIQ